MFQVENKIAQAEHALFVAKFNKPAAEGMTVQVPNAIDRMVAWIKHTLTPVAMPARHQPYRGTYTRNVVAR